MKRIGAYILGKSNEDADDCFSDQYKRQSPIGEKTINLVTQKKKKVQEKKGYAVQRKRKHDDTMEDDDSDDESMTGINIQCRSNNEVPNVSSIHQIYNNTFS